jgi:hypothetical protein
MHKSQKDGKVDRLVALEKEREDGPVSFPENSPGDPTLSEKARDIPRRPDNLSESLSVRVRPVGLTDLPRLASFEKTYPLFQPEQSLKAYRVWSSSLRAKTPRSHTRPAVLVAESNGRLIAFADFRPMGHDRRWCLVALGAATGVFDPTPIWSEIILAGVRKAALNGVKRLYARACPETNAEVALRRAGYQPYANETIFVADSPIPLTGDARAREQDSSDTWSIHQLYNASVPREVLHAEAFTSHKWEIQNSRRPGSQVVAGWLIEEPSGPVAYARTVSSGDAHTIDLIFQPGRLDQGVALVDATLRRLRHERKVSRVFISVRGYASEIESALLKRGFTPGLSQNLLVKYTAVPVRAVVTEAAGQPLEIGERIPSRAPSILLRLDRKIVVRTVRTK